MYRVVCGGSFDPIHLGHLAIADAIHREIAPDELLWVPARIAPHKQDLPPAAAADRLAMLQAATQDRPQEAILEWELQRPPPSYTVHTLRELQKLDDHGKIDLVLGMDSISHLPTWHCLDEVLELAGFLFVPRPGTRQTDIDDFRTMLPQPLQAKFRAQWVPMLEVPISSTQIRARLAEGDRCQQFLPAAVEQLIRARGLYQA
jgi:nicotinate-nucleotide adenylyltransferase